MTMIIVAQNKQIVFSQFPVSILFIKKICQVIFRDYMYTYLFQVKYIVSVAFDISSFIVMSNVILSIKRRFNFFFSHRNSTSFEKNFKGYNIMYFYYYYKSLFLR